MGKRKTGALVRRKKRIKATVEEHIDEKIETGEAAKLEAKADDDLFVIDMAPRGGAVAPDKRKKKSASVSASKSTIKSTKSSSIVSEKSKKSKKHRISDLDEVKIEKLIAAHSKEGVIALASRKHTKKQVERKMSNRGKILSNATFDLWSDDSDPSNTSKTKIVPVVSGVMSMGGTAPVEFKVISKDTLRKDIQQPGPISNKLRKTREIFSNTTKKTVPIEVAQPGQSYRPDKEQHQDVIGEALSIELRRKEALDQLKKPVGGGEMEEETKALLVHSDSDDDRSSDESEDEVEDETVGRLQNQKKKEKVTHAKRNKRKRAKAIEIELKEKKKEKKLLNSIHDAKRLTKELQQEEATQLARRMEIRSLKEEKEAEPLGVNVLEKLSSKDPLNTPALPVALTSELKDNGGSLRAIKPKGSLLTDRMESMINRKMANTRVVNKKNIVQGKRRKMKAGKGREYLLV